MVMHVFEYHFNSNLLHIHENCTCSHKHVNIMSINRTVETFQVKYDHHTHAHAVQNIHTSQNKNEEINNWSRYHLFIYINYMYTFGGEKTLRLITFIHFGKNTWCFCNNYTIPKLAKGIEQVPAEVYFSQTLLLSLTEEAMTARSLTK